jgi:hypothetical protein
LDHDPARCRCGPISWCALLLSMFLLGCAEDPFEPMGSFNATECGGIKRVIGFLKSPSTTCGDIINSAAAGWVATPLFSGDEVPYPLNRYCLITPEDPRDPKELPPIPYTFAELVNDGPVVYPQAPPPLRELSREHRRWIHDAVGGLESLPSTPIPTPVELDIIDNARDSEYPALPAIPSGDPGMHGTVLAHMARDIGCPEGDGDTRVCPTRVVTKLAMRNLGGQPDLRGTRGELAQAIYSAVDQWKRSIIEGSVIGWRLVLNISLGWEDDYLWEEAFCGPPEIPGYGLCERDLPPEHIDRASRAVYDALVYARCYGVLPLAATGNYPISYSIAQNRLMSPGQFMQWDAPRDGDKTCESYGTNDFKLTYETAAAGAGLELALHPATELENEPLVYPIGAVDFGGRALVPVRIASIPDLVGPGLLGTSYEGDYTLHSLPPNNVPSSLTGSSVGALTASAVAATVWAYSPQVSAGDIMNIVYNNGEPLSEGNGSKVYDGLYYFDKPREIRHVSLCKTLRGIGILGGPSCPDVLGSLASQNPQLSAAVATWSDFLPVVNIPASPIDLASIELKNSLSGYIEYNDDRDEYSNADLECEVGPQPLWPSCTRCSLTSISSDPPESVLDLSELANPNITNVVLVVVHDDGSNSLYGDLETVYGTKDGPLINNLGPRNALIRLNVSVEVSDRAFLDWTDDAGHPRFSQIAIY